VDRLGDVAVELCGALQTSALGAYPRHLQAQMAANPNFALTEFHKVRERKVLMLWRYKGSVDVVMHRGRMQRRLVEPIPWWYRRDSKCVVVNLSSDGYGLTRPYSIHYFVLQLN
jgi:hypothetical protein